MVASFSLSTNFMVVLALACSVQALSISLPQRDLQTINYTKTHSLGDSYDFHRRDGWISYNVSNITPRTGSGKEVNSGIAKRSEKARKKKGSKKLKGLSVIGGAIRKIISAVITWYTGNDLLNPSCWPQPVWTPTDHSFVGAITEIGWEGSPKCFDFLELCRDPKKCIFVRVVDTCAGCAPGSKHVDLTKAAFTELANIDEGMLSVNLRFASEPKKWNEDLWGPK
ncbi:Non-catalytic module family EXPN protein [Armillaria luteobubalina]|uniref:Non-catalytic module family EXPN protein n=1 Tax=Armillaria luteobubalina TaxID=153913 RepID=A0AA39PNG7_9AGAR|nr:Non-catalytic module family EXPN protein [Armillaria luteobubalina]